MIDCFSAEIWHTRWIDYTRRNEQYYVIANEREINVERRTSLIPVGTVVITYLLYIWCIIITPWARTTTTMVQKINTKRYGKRTVYTCCSGERDHRSAAATVHHSLYYPWSMTAGRWLVTPEKRCCSGTVLLLLAINRRMLPLTHKVVRLIFVFGNHRPWLWIKLCRSRNVNYDMEATVHLSQPASLVSISARPCPIRFRSVAVSTLGRKLWLGDYV